MSKNGNTPHPPEESSDLFEEIELVQTQDEDGNLHLFEKIDEIEVDGKEYALLIYRGQQEEMLDPHMAAPKTEGDDEEDDEVVVMKITYEDGLQVFENIEDEAEFEKVVEAIEYLQEEEGDDDEPEGVTFQIGELLEGVDFEFEEDDEEKKN